MALVASMFSLCLFGDCPVLRNSSILSEVAAAFADVATQWMIFVCAGMYFVAFVVLRSRLAGGGRAGMRWNAWLPGELWLLGLVAVAVLAYAFDYTQAVKSTQALVLLSGAMLGQGAAFFESRKQKAENRNGGGGILVVLVVLLAAAAGWQAETTLTFQYRGQTRWSGPWDNPNTFGMLMGVGVVLCLGMVISGNAEKLKIEMLKAEGERPRANSEQPTSNAEHRTLKWVVWLKGVFFLGAAGVMGWGLLKSYSRGAWLGTLMGVAYLFWNAEGKRKNAESRCSRGSRVSWALLILVSLCVLAFWGFRDTERLVARRAFSVGNVNDFSWRNRVAAYEGALQMMAEKPWLGFGWNQAERVYDQFYRMPQVVEGAAIQLNDYLTLGTTLGVPALLCFLMYIGLALTRPLTTDYRSLITDHRLLATDYRSLITDYCSKTTCRAGALVLLVGFWFDGGLFKLATASTFWILLELGRAENHEIHEPHEKD